MEKFQELVDNLLIDSREDKKEEPLKVAFTMRY